jgi:hypothetical protein
MRMEQGLVSYSRDQPPRELLSSSFLIMALEFARFAAAPQGTQLRVRTVLVLRVNASLEDTTNLPTHRQYNRSTICPLCWSGWFEC